MKLSHGGIIIIPPNHLVGHRGGINPLAQLGMATGHPCSRIGNQQHTHLRVRRHDGGDVPTFRDDAPGGAGDELTLPAYQLSADVKIGSDRTHRGGHVRMPDSFGHVVSVDSDGGGLRIGVDGQLSLASKPRDCRLIGAVQPLLEHKPGNGPIHRASVEECQVEPASDPARRGRLA